MEYIDHLIESTGCCDDTEFKDPFPHKARQGVEEYPLRFFGEVIESEV